MRPYRLPSALAICAAVLTMPFASANERSRVEDVPLGRQAVRDQVGNTRYMVLLNEEVASHQPIGSEPPPLATWQRASRSDFRMWHRANVRSLVRHMEADYGVQAVSMTSWAMPSFTAYFAPSAIEKLRADMRVETAFPILEGDVSYASWIDRCEAAERVSWGKAAIGTDDAATTTNWLYMIDGAAPAHADLPGLFFPPNPVNPGYGAAPGHATHVAGIMAAASNGATVRGINPGATVVRVNRGDADDDVAAAFDWALADSEQRGLFGVANFSSSAGRFAAGGALNFVFRRISNRLLVVQAAGNRRIDACAEAYGPPRANDGILVVGGIDENGKWAAPYDNTPSGYQSALGTNWGFCIEVWGPSQRIRSTWDTTPLMELSGTSMAAPHVSALAARYGTASTTPVEREHYIRSRLYATGHSDRGLAIMVPSFTQPPTFAVPGKLPVTGVRAHSTLGGTSAASAADGLYLTGLWNFGSGAGPLSWIELDLGTSRTVTGIRMTPEQFPSGTVSHNIHIANFPMPGVGDPSTIVATIGGPSANLEPLAGSFTAVGRYIRVHTVVSPSWVAWREIEIYGF